MNEQNIQTPAEEEEIDILKLLKTVWNGRKTLYITLFIGTLFGLFVAIFTPKTFSVTTIMVPQMDQSKSKLGSLGGLAALAGIDIGSSITSGELSPILYPKIVNSIPFKLELMNAKLQFEGIKEPVTLYDYYINYSKPNVLGVIKKYTLGLPGIIIKAIRPKAKEAFVGKGDKNTLIYLTEDQYAVKKIIDEILFLDVDAKEGYLTLTAQMPEALAAAQLAQKAQDILQRDITAFKIEKAQANLDFIQERYDVAKGQAEGYQMGLAQKSDQYKNLTSSVPQVETTRISTRYGIANTVFQELAKQLEQAKIQVKKDTPVFTIIEPASIPNEKSKPSRPLILIIWMFLGGVVGVAIIFAKPLLADMKKKWAEE